MNLLFTCVGRRNYLLQYFREAMNGSGILIGTDNQRSAPAMAAADVAIQAPRINDPQYIPFILSLCEKHQARALISLNDLELPLLAKHAKDFEQVGTTAIVSSPHVIDICFDKIKTSEFILSLGLNTPTTLTSLPESLQALENGDLQFPLIVKPRWGSASIGIFSVDDQEELQLAYALARRGIEKTILKEASLHEIDRSILIQEKIIGPEYGLDIINDLQANHSATIVKKKLAMRAGETDKAMTVQLPEVMNMGRTIAQTLRHVGNLDCDILERNGQYYVLEMNPRFGGGYPFSQMAGVNVPKAILCWLANQPAPDELFHAEIGKSFAKCDTLIEVEN